MNRVKGNSYWFSFFRVQGLVDLSSAAIHVWGQLFVPCPEPWVLRSPCVLASSVLLLSFSLLSGSAHFQSVNTGLTHLAEEKDLYPQRPAHISQPPPRSRGVHSVWRVGREAVHSWCAASRLTVLVPTSPQCLSIPCLASRERAQPLSSVTGLSSAAGKALDCSGSWSGRSQPSSGPLLL